MKELSKLLPFEDLIYLGDTANLPYGNKSPETILRFAEDNASFLLEKGIKMLLIPCHTACSHALALLQKKLQIPVIGVIEPGLELLKGYKRVALLATSGTIGSGVYQKLIKKQNPDGELFSIACPLFVPLVEEGFYEHRAAELIAEEYVGFLRGKVDAVLLACTHYPLMRTVLERVLGNGVELIEPASLCAMEAFRYLKEEKLLNGQKGKPSHLFFASDDPDKFRRLGEIFLGAKIERVERK